MGTSSVSQSFVFITSTNQLVPDDVEARKRIRKQAMSRPASARRRRGDYGKHNLLQYPNHLTALAYPGDHAEDARAETAIPPSAPCAAYERLRMRYNVDLLDLSVLTSFHVSYGTARSLASNPAVLRAILGSRQWSYLTYLPARLGYSDVLNRATECVAARVRQWLASPFEPISRDILRLYSGALQAVQAALDSPDTCLQPEVLCATELLGIYELLKMSTSEQGWTCHSSGSTALIKLRGPDHYKTDFEKALLLSHLGQVFHESLNAKERCFLEHEAWQTALRSVAIIDDVPFSDRSELVLSLWTYVFRLPYLFQQTTEVIFNINNPDGISAAHNKVYHLKPELHRLRRSISHWYQQHGRIQNNDGGDRDPRDSKQIDDDRHRQHEAVSLALICLITTNRLTFALDPAGEADREDEAQRIAAEVLRINGGGRASAGSRVELFMALKIHVANTTRATAESWKSWDATGQETPQSRPGPCTITRRLLAEWYRLTGWNTC